MSNETYVFIIVVLFFFWAYPVFRMTQACLIEKSMDTRLGLITLGVHLIAVAGLWHAREFGFLLLYLAVTSTLWLVSPAFGNMHEFVSMRRMQNDDIKRYENILARDPHNGAALSALADIYLDRGRYDDAIAYFEQVIAISPDHSRREHSRLLYARQLRDERQSRRHKQQSPKEGMSTPANKLVTPDMQASALPGQETSVVAQKQNEEQENEQEEHEVARWFDSLEEEG